ncbi:hypothetical protein [Streptomyces sp.]|uniref:hypothetical protein n=1 Tax=Streptomyces sp. TaxID=1931 RepID=UPI00281138C3|nr:hypothetical protein [Streptomyces sp.]
MAVTRAQVRALLDPSGENRSLVLLEGRTEVVPSDRLASEPYRGAMEITSGRELAATLPSGTPTEQDIDAVASRLGSAITHLGA